MRNSDKLSALGVKDDDLLMMMVSNASSGYVRWIDITSCYYSYFALDHGLSLLALFSSSNAARSDLGMNPDGSALNPAAFQQHIRGDANLMGQLFQV